MTQAMETPQDTEDTQDAFVNRRSYVPTALGPSRERRQFADSYDGLSPDAAELASAIDEYKLHHRRRFITHEEMLAVFKSLGYSKS